MSYKYYTKIPKDKSLSEEKKSLFCDFFLAVKKVYISRVGCSFYRILECEPKHKRNKSKYEAKTQIVKNRINNMVMIIEDKNILGKVEAFYRILMKSFLIKILFTNDNYLQTHSNLELYRFRNFSAYLKLIYAIRLSATRKFILRAYFCKLKKLINDYVPIKALSLNKCILNKISRGRGYHKTYLKRTLQNWKKISILTRPNPLFFDKERRNLNILNFLSQYTRKINYRSFNHILRYLAEKEDKRFLNEINEDLSSINTVVNYKRNAVAPEKLVKAKTISQLESLYSSVYSIMRESLTKEIKLYKNTNILKGVFNIIYKKLVDKKISVRFSLWRAKIDYIKFQKINKKVEKYSKRKQMMSLVLLEKIVYKIDQYRVYWKNFFLDRLILHTKLKNSLKDYGFYYRRMPDYLVNEEDSKGQLLIIRKTYTKVFKLMRMFIILSRKRKIPIFDKNKKIVKEDNFKLNNTFLKWKKFTIESFSSQYKTFLACSKIVKVLYIKEMRIYLDLIRILSNNPKDNIFENSYSNQEKEKLAFVIKKIYTKAQLIAKRNVMDIVMKVSKEKLRKRNMILKNYVLSKFYVERANNKNSKFYFLRKWKNFSLKQGIILKGKSRSFLQTNTVKILLFFKLIEKTIKQKILKWFKSKIQRLKAIDESKKIDYYVNLNQAKACLELEKTEKELDKLYFQTRIKLFNTDTLCKLIFKKATKEGRRIYFRKWRNSTLGIQPINDSFMILINERDLLLGEKKQLESSMGEYNQHYEKVNEEYLEFKKIFCKNCLQVDDGEMMENKSVRTKNEKSQKFGSGISKSGEFYVSNEDGEFIEPNKIVSNEMKLHEEVTLKKNDSSLKQKIVEIENKINSLKTEYDQKLQSNEKFLKIYEEKKKELMNIKKEIMSKLNSSVSSKKQLK